MSRIWVTYKESTKDGCIREPQLNREGVSSEGNMVKEVGRGPYLLEPEELALNFILWAVGAQRDSSIQQIGFEHGLCARRYF